MQTYAHYVFEELLVDEDNLACFDCGKVPAQWASINNGIYLCINCSGEHRGYGVTISFMRSITIDKWNDNQIQMMSNGGNKKLRELLDVYSIDRFKVDKKVLYSSRLLDFYRRLLKSKINKDLFDREPPSKEDALKSLNVDVGGFNSIAESKNGKQDRFKAVTYTSSSDKVEEDTGFTDSLNSWMVGALEGTQNIASNVLNRTLTTTTIVAETSSQILDKGTEIASSETVRSFATKANDGINFVINKLFGGSKKEDIKEEKKSGSENVSIDLNNNVKIKK